MKFSSIFVGLLVGLLAPVLIGVATAAAAVLGLGRNLAATARTTRKSTSTGIEPDKDAEVVRRPKEGATLEELRPAA